MKIATFDDVSGIAKPWPLRNGPVIRDSYREAGNPKQDHVLRRCGKYNSSPGLAPMNWAAEKATRAAARSVRHIQGCRRRFTNFKLWSCMQDGLKQDNYVEINLAATTTVKSVSKFE